MRALGSVAELEARAGVRGLEDVYRRLAEGLAPVAGVRAA
jgi:hypothetical protein